MACAALRRDLIRIGHVHSSGKIVDPAQADGRSAADHLFLALPEIRTGVAESRKTGSGSHVWVATSEHTSTITEAYMFRKMVTAAFLSVAACSMASAQDTTRNWELLLSGGGSNNNDFDAGAFNVNAQVGYYFGPQWQVNFRQSFGYVDGVANSSWTGASRVGLDYHFDFGQDQRWVPFVGAELGYLYGDDFDETWAAGPEAGLKVYVNDTTFIYGSVLYEFYFDSGDDADDAFDDGQFVYNLGVGFRW